MRIYLNTFWFSSFSKTLKKRHHLWSILQWKPGFSATTHACNDHHLATLENPTQPATFNLVWNHNSFRIQWFSHRWRAPSQQFNCSFLPNAHCKKKLQHYHPSFAHKCSKIQLLSHSSKFEQVSPRPSTLPERCSSDFNQFPICLFLL